ncbi:Hypothetical predicted protein [Paramuricea clavata]|uniref:Uncharacterized protein n=1 Tax=Paramuricea clavata TaxID=317549 RepID=A0A7D9HF53_PARCT|nr:Hypothetical predicted protein [Paramuricea clavata]
MMKKLLRNFKVKSWWSKTRWRTSSSPIKKMKRNWFIGVQRQQYVICVTLESIKAKTNRAWLNKVNSKNDEDLQPRDPIQHRQDESNTSFIKEKEILHEGASYVLVRREDKCEVKTTRSSKKRQYTIELR